MTDHPPVGSRSFFRPEQRRFFARNSAATSRRLAIASAVYRGTTRGFEFSLVDILSISLLISAVLAPRREGQSRFFWPASFGMMLLFFAYACFNVAMAARMIQLRAKLRLNSVERGCREKVNER